MKKSLEEKIHEWMETQSAETLVCFQCKGWPEHIYFPEDFSWQPVLICRKCRDHFDDMVEFVNTNADGEYH